MSSTVSIIVPTYNEEKDIASVMDSLVKLDYVKKEILVVDDRSTDNTTSIVESYSKKHSSIRLIKKERNEGVALTRNRGIIEAKGEIIIILNADVILPPDFIKKILPHYARGADFLLVEAEALHLERLFPRYVNTVHHFLYDNQDWIAWSEGFSCRKKAAVEIGLFPYVGVNAAGEDAVFGQTLEKKGYKKAIDKSIVVNHYVPESLHDFWNQRMGRGKGTVYMLHYMEKKGRSRILFSLAGKHIPYTLFYVSTLIIPLYESFRLIKKTKGDPKDLIPFTYTSIIDRLGKFAGSWDAFFRLLKEK